MSEKTKVETDQDELPLLEPEIVEPDLDAELHDLEAVIPKMNVSVPTPAEQQPQPESILITDDALLGIYGEILDNARKDRGEIDGYITSFADMVINENDASSASKEALVNLINAKSGILDKMAKVADLMTRVKLKDKDTFPRYLAANQNNTINIQGDPLNNKREILEAIERSKKKGKK